MPALAAALESGALHWSAVRELTRVAVAETEHDWIAQAVGKTLRQVEEARALETEKWLAFYDAQHAIERARIELLRHTGTLTASIH